jgi:acetyl-CoA acyltransferase
VDLSAHVLRSLAERSGVDPTQVHDVVWGCVSQGGEQAFDIARTAVLAAGWPDEASWNSCDHGGERAVGQVPTATSAR